MKLLMLAKIVVDLASIFATAAAFIFWRFLQ